MLDIVITTIGDGSFLDRWAKLIEQAGRADIRLVVIPDRNTPDLTEVVSRHPFAVCPSPDEQVAFLASLGCDDGFIPWRSDNRRNVGYLMSWRDGADVMISVDDDNIPVDAAWFDFHEAAMIGPAKHHIETAEWFNPCDLLNIGLTIYARGFPYFARGRKRGEPISKTADVAINSGLWLGDPDVDAVTRLATRPFSYATGLSVVLDAGTWAPVNSQNTAIRRDVIPAYWFTRMPSWGGRMGDIFQGYFAQACAKHLGHAVRFGTPLVTHERNQHDLLADLEAEVPFYRLIEELCAWLPGVTLEGSTYRDAYESLAWAVDAFAQRQPLHYRAFLQDTAERMQTWLGLCDQIGRQ